METLARNFCLNMRADVSNLGETITPLKIVVLFTASFGLLYTDRIIIILLL